MFNVQAVVLKQLLTSGDRGLVVESFGRLRKEYFTHTFSSIYVAVQSYYLKHGAMPSLDALAMGANRNLRLSQALAVLEKTSVPDVPLAQSIDVLETEFTQDLVLDLLDEGLLRDLQLLDKDEIISRLTSLAIQVEDRVGHDSGISHAKDATIFKEYNDSSMFVPLGISNDMDVQNPVKRSEVVLFGGRKGTGKSIVCSNIQVSNYKMGVICPYYTLEMKAHEVFDRNLAILAGVKSSGIRKQLLPAEDVQQLLKTRATMFHGGIDLFKEYSAKYTINSMSDGFELESQLRTLEEVTPMPVIYDSRLTIPKMEGITRGLILKHGMDKVTLQILDYINQVRIEGASDTDMYGWTDQMVVSKSFKDSCGRLEVGGVSPFQIDSNGEARMSKGILDSCDTAYNLSAAKQQGKDAGSEGAIMLESVKSRHEDSMVYISAIDWNSLKINQTANLSKQQVAEMGALFNTDVIEKPVKGKKKEEPKKTGVPSGASDL